MNAQAHMASQPIFAFCQIRIKNRFSVPWGLEALCVSMKGQYKPREAQVALSVTSGCLDNRQMTLPSLGWSVKCMWQGMSSTWPHDNWRGNKLKIKRNVICLIYFTLPPVPDDCGIIDIGFNMSRNVIHGNMHREGDRVRSLWLIWSSRRRGRSFLISVLTTNMDWQTAGPFFSPHQIIM